MRDPYEKDIENAIVTVLSAQITADGHTGVNVRAITLGSPGDERDYPLVHVACAPLEHKGAGVKEWRGNVVVNIQTKHITDRDRTATTLVSLLGSVGYALDFGDFTAEANVLNSINVRRTTGDYEFSDSTNEVNIPCEIIACGLQTP